MVSPLANQICNLLTFRLGQVVIHSLSSPESYAFDMRRPMRTISLEPNFAKNTARAFVCGGMAGSLVMHEKGWLGHKETPIHSGEGPIWTSKWRGNLIAWANDLVSRIGSLDIPSNILVHRVSKYTTGKHKPASPTSTDRQTVHEPTSSSATYTGKMTTPSSSHGQTISKSLVFVPVHDPSQVHPHSHPYTPRSQLLSNSTV